MIIVRKFIAVIILSLLLFGGCSRKKDEINLGFIGTLSGRYSDLGQAVLQGAMLAVENSKDADRINLIVKDDYGIPSEGVKGLTELAGDGVKYVIGPDLSSVASAVVPMLEANKMYMLSPTVSTSSLAGKDDNFYRIMPYNSFKQSVAISKYLRSKLNIKSVTVIYDSRNASYSDDIVRKFSEAFMRAGGKILDVRAFNPDSGNSFNQLIEEDKKEQPDLYYIIGSAMDTSLIIWQIKKAGYHSKILIRKWAASNEFYRLGGSAVNGVMLFDYYIDKEMPDYKLFEGEYKKRFQKDPSWMSVYGYEAARMMVESVRQVRKGSDLLDALNAAAKDNKLLLNCRLDKYGDAYLPLHYFIITRGKAVYQEIAE